jgi:CHASE3 domain sensor protein
MSKQYFKELRRLAKDRPTILKWIDELEKLWENTEIATNNAKEIKP